MRIRRSNGSVAAIFALLLPASALAAPAIAKFPIPAGTIPTFMTTGPDGAVWSGGEGAVFRISDTGSVSRFPLPQPNSVAGGITTGADGNLWFTEDTSTSPHAAAIYRMTPAGKMTAFPVAGAGTLLGIAAGSDGNLWFTDDRSVDKAFAGDIGRITLSGTITEQPVPAAAGEPLFIAAGPDGAVWFTAHSTTATSLVRVAPDFSFHVFPLSLGGYDTLDVAAARDGNLWFTAVNTNDTVGEIGRMTPQGSVNVFPIPTPTAIPEIIAPGPCLDVWFTAFDAVGRATLDGKVTLFPFSDENKSALPGLAPDAQRNVWFADQKSPAFVRVDTLGCRALLRVVRAAEPNPSKVHGER